MDKQLIWIPLGSFLVLCNDVWHGGLCGGKGNIRVHGSIFVSVTIETTKRLTYPNSPNLASLKSTHNTIYKKVQVWTAMMRLIFLKKSF